MHQNWRLLLHSDTMVADPRVTHGHHDLFSFDLSFDGLPIIVDPGRRNYAIVRDAPAAGILEEYHNTLIVDETRTGFCPRGYMPTNWLKSFRACPTIVRKGNTLNVSLQEKLPRGIKLMDRTFISKSAGGVQILSTVAISDGKPHLIKLLLHLAGKVELKTAGALIIHENARFFLDWGNLPKPTMKPVERYTAYEQVESCLRLEWLLSVNSPHWESIFSIAREKTE